MTRDACVSRWLGALAALLITGLSGPARAQESVAVPDGTDKPAPCAFGAAAESHAQAGRRLAVSRGFSLPEPTSETASDASPSEGEIIGWLGQRISAGTYPAGTHVLFYARRGGQLAMWLFGAGGIVACARQPIPAQSLASQVSELMGALGIQERQLARAARPIGDSDPDVVAPTTSDDGLMIAEATEQLSSSLFPAAITSALGAVRHLVIVPTGDLGAIPYAALSPWGEGTQIVDRFSVSVAPSLHSLGRPVPRWNAAEAFARPLIVGDPRLPPTTGWSIPPLPGAEAEAREVGGMLDSPVIVGAAATKALVSARADGASLLYIATHGIANPDNPVDGGFLMLAGESFESGWWTARTIQTSRLDARLAVLSACQTGLGQAHEGGMIGLARAFQLAGVPRVLMSLWNVDDEATRFLMVRFMEHARRHPPAEALRRAMIEARRQFEHPALWASFLLFSEAA